MVLSLYPRIPFIIWRLMRNRQLKPTELRELQSKKLKALVKHSYDYVPYYHSLFKEAELHPDDIKSIDDLSKIPILKKEDIRNAQVEEITPTNMDLSTSGTTGIPISVYCEKEAMLTMYLGIYVWQLNCGDKVTDKHVVLGGSMFTPPRPIQKIGIFRTKNISPFDEIETQIVQIKNFNPKTMVTSPSCVVGLCKEIRERNIQGINPRLVFTGGELLNEHVRNFVRETFHAELYDGYGSVESGWISSECVELTGYHVWSDSVIVEITEDGEAVSKGEEGDITVTNLDQYAMPIIRYDQGDLGILIDEECPCGCNFPLMKITIGRKIDVIQLPDGRAISARNVYSDLNLIQGIKQYQVIQEKIDRLTVKIVKDSRFTEETCEEVSQMFKQKLGNVEVDISLFDDIQRDKSGKFKPFITKIPVKY
jgi:phenylacetate-CoA ligase